MTPTPSSPLASASPTSPTTPSPPPASTPTPHPTPSNTLYPPPQPPTTTTLFHRTDLTPADINKAITLGLAISPQGTLYTAWGTVTEILKLPSLVLVQPTPPPKPKIGPSVKMQYPPKPASNSSSNQTTGIPPSPRRISRGLITRRASILASTRKTIPSPPEAIHKPWRYKDLTIHARKTHAHLCGSSCSHPPGVEVVDCPPPLPALGSVAAGIWVDEVGPRAGGNVMLSDGVVLEVLTGGVSVAVVEPMGLMEMDDLCDECCGECGDCGCEGCECC
ncbi:hypothetical protein BDW74DRAFT_183982 [Aspergillus multicolor]|uniref:uncharacterized protein n=1 Tax=Aspergillus multicolor TaxID=41759 RepID=UPI003CCD872D